MITLFAFWLSVLFFVIVLLWLLVPALYGLPPVPTNRDRIHHALQLAKLQPDEILYDLGAGDGRVLLIAARDFKAQAVGIEIGPIQCILIWFRVMANGLASRIKIHWGNFYQATIKDADVVFVYATSKEVMKLAPHLAAQMRQGSRLVSISADFGEWEPALVEEHDLIFIYEMPPTLGSVTTYMLKKTN
jgi:precorrin-6B methylase 2